MFTCSDCGGLRRSFLIVSWLFLACAFSFAQGTESSHDQETKDHGNLKPVTLFLEGDSSSIPKFINLCRQKGPERGLSFKFVDKKEDSYDYRVILSTEGSGVWNYAHGNIVVMNPEAKVLFTVTRSNRLTAKGSASALAKEFVKVLARYVDTHR